MLNKQKFISEFLVAKGILNYEVLDQVKQAQKRTQERVDTILRNLGIPCDENLEELIINELGLNFVEPSVFVQELYLLESINTFSATRFRIFPLRFEEEKLIIAVDNPLSFISLDYFQEILGRPVEAQMIKKKQMDALLHKFYSTQTSKTTAEQESMAEEGKDPI